MSNRAGRLGYKCLYFEDATLLPSLSQSLPRREIERRQTDTKIKERKKSIK